VQSGSSATAWLGWRYSCVDVRVGARRFGRMDTHTLPALLDADDPMLRLAVAAHLARHKGQSRAHTASDLNAYVRWCLERDVTPLQAQPCLLLRLTGRWSKDVEHGRSFQRPNATFAPIHARASRVWSFQNTRVWPPSAYVATSGVTGSRSTTARTSS
jgi:hypothetical protein